MGLSVQRRREIERAIVARVINQALHKGYLITINSGGDDDDIRACSDQIVTFMTGDQKPLGSMHFVYGNSGYDVISDYTSNRYMRELVIECNAMIAAYETEAIHAK